MKHFHISAEILSPLPQVQPGEQSTREVDQKILEDVLLAHYVKRRKVLNEVTEEILSNSFLTQCSA